MAGARAVIGAGTAAATTVVARRALEHVATSPQWTRTNFRGRPVRLTGGVAVAIGAISGAMAAAIGGGPVGPGAVLIAGGSSALAGGYDDLLAPAREVPTDKGWQGHLRAVRAGRLSGGVIKVLVIGAGAALASARIQAGSSTRAGRLSDRLVSATLIAGSANLVNLFDLRPGRAGKIVLGTALGLGGGPAGGVALASGAAALAALPGDLAERHLLGDVGANPLGALLGLRLAAGGPRTRLGALVVVLGLTAAGERVSFSRVIDSSSWLRRLDGWGRQPGGRAVDRPDGS